MNRKNFLKKAAIVTALGLTIGMTGCTDAERAKIGGLGDEHRVELYSGGELVRTWTSSGKVHSEQHSDGYYFNDKDTGLLIEVAGDVVITRLN